MSAEREAEILHEWSFGREGVDPTLTLQLGKRFGLPVTRYCAEHGEWSPWRANLPPLEGAEFIRLAGAYHLVRDRALADAEQKCREQVDFAASQKIKARDRGDDDGLLLCEGAIRAASGLADAIAALRKEG